MAPPTSGNGSTSTAGAGAGAPAKMRMVTSCKGCSALRKGCSDDCAIRPCLQWIKNDPEAQGRATHFLAKFYGRAGLQNLIAAAPAGAADRPAVFRSLLYEACGRIVNPVYGSVGLLWSRQWDKCVDAVEAVLKGDLDHAVFKFKGDHNPNPNPVVQQAVDAAVAAASGGDAAPPPLAAARPGAPAAFYDIRHFAKDSDAAAAADLLRFARSGRARPAFKRAAGSSSSSNASKAMPMLLKGKGKASTSNNVRASSQSPHLGQEQEAAEELEPVPMVVEPEHVDGRVVEFAFAGILGHHLQGSNENTDVEAVPPPPVVGDQVLAADQEAEEEVGLELTLG